MQNLRWRNWPFGVKLAGFFTILVVVAGIVIASLVIRRQQLLLQGELAKQADLLLILLEAAAKDAIYVQDVDTLTGLVQRLGEREASITIGRYYDSEGRIIADAFDRTLGQRFQVSELGLELLDLKPGEVIYIWEEEQLIAGKAIYLGNQKLGAIGVGLSTEVIREQIDSIQTRGVSIGFIAIFLSMVFGWAYGRITLAPLNRLLEATSSITHGDFSHPIAVSENRDEFSRLGTAMESMRSELQKLYQGLEKQVEERTEALVESEARFREVVSSVSDHIYLAGLLLDGSWTYDYVSPNVEELTGYPTAKFIENPAFWLSLILEEDLPVVDNQRQFFIAGEDCETEYRIQPKEGDVIWVRDSGRVVQSTNPGKTLVYGVISEITDRKLTEQSLREARDHALEASRLKTELLANVSHELRTPLGAILGYSEMMREGVFGPVNEQQTSIADEIIESTNYLTDLVSGLLDQAKIEAERMNLRESPFSPSDLINQVYAQMNGMAQSKGIRLLTDFDSTAPATVIGDADRIRQILMNLVGNAIKFTETGRVTISLYKNATSTWCVSVEDTGIGIPEDAQQFIFDAFRQVDASMTRKHGGTGLGLSLVKQFITMMGGQIELQSTVGEGSRFTVTLPVDPAYLKK